MTNNAPNSSPASPASAAESAGSHGGAPALPMPSRGRPLVTFLALMAVVLLLYALLVGLEDVGGSAMHSYWDQWIWGALLLGLLVLLPRSQAGQVLPRPASYGAGVALLAVTGITWVWFGPIAAGFLGLGLGMTLAWAIDWAGRQALLRGAGRMGNVLFLVLGLGLAGLIQLCALVSIPFLLALAAFLLGSYGLGDYYDSSPYKALHLAAAILLPVSLLLTGLITWRSRRVAKRRLGLLATPPPKATRKSGASGRKKSGGSGEGWQSFDDAKGSQ